MKIRFICTLTLTAMLFVACNSNKQKGDDQLPSDEQENTDVTPSADTSPDSSESTSASDDATEERTTSSIPIQDEFFSITNLTNIDILFEQGPPSIQFEGPSRLLQNLRYEYDGGVLTFRSEGSTDEFSKQVQMAEKALLRISYNKELRIIAVCAAGSFVSHKPFRTSQFQAGCMGSGSITIDDIDCQSFRYEATGPGSATFGNIRADEVKILQYGTGPIDVRSTAKTQAIIDLGNTGSVTADITSPQVETISSGEGSLDLHVETQNLEAAVLGTGTTTLSGHAAQTKLKTTKNGKIINQLSK